MGRTVRVGVVGCGAISGAYLRTARSLPILEIAACADLDADRARARAAEFGVPRACSVAELLDDDTLEIVLNLTVPAAHAPVGLEAISRGRHTFSEKPLGITREEGAALGEASRERGVRLGCAPDTFLGSGLQTARKALDQGAIGRPVAFTALMLCPGHESWHPNPEFYYRAGGGPMLDMGPYYLTALLNLLGPPSRLTGSAAIAIPERIITSAPLRGRTVRVETPDHVCGTLEFASGAAGVLMMSFAARHPVYERSHPLTIYGTAGTMKVPDPNGFDGAVLVRAGSDEEWREVPPAFPTGYGRAVGLADMAHALRSGRPHRASAEQAFAVLDLMQGFFDSARTGTAYLPSAPYERPAPMPVGLPFGELE